MGLRSSYIRDDRGSLSPLILTYFLITLIVIFIGINVTHSYLERRHLILAMESSLQRATQEIDDFSYYYGYEERNTVRTKQRGVTTFVPIDCKAAKSIFDQEFTTQWALTKALNLADQDVAQDRDLRSGGGSTVLWSNRSRDPANSQQTELPTSRTDPRSRLMSIPRVIGFSCDGKTISSTAELLVELPFQISFAGVDLVSHSRQVATVEVGLIFGG